MRELDQPQYWQTRITEINIIDPETNKEYCCVFGLARSGGKFCVRIFDLKDQYVFGDWVVKIIPSNIFIVSCSFVKLLLDKAKEIEPFITYC